MHAFPTMPGPLALERRHGGGPARQFAGDREHAAGGIDLAGQSRVDRLADLVYGLAIGVGLPELLLNKVVFLR